MSVTYGLTAAGFVTKPQSQIISEIESSLQDTFGQNINLGPESNFGQLVGIFSEREALIWQLAEAVYASENPNFAEGTSVDNILALNNLKRLLATATRTNPSPVTNTQGITLYGIVLRGTPGTVIPSGSIAQTSASPPLQFTLDNSVTIAPSVNALQSIFQSNSPTSGAFQLSISSPAGNTLSTPSLSYNILPQTSAITFASVPVSGNFSLTLTLAGSVLNTATLPFNATAAQIQSAINFLSGYSGVTVSGTMSAGFQIAWGNIANPKLSFNTNTTGVAATFQDSLQALFNALYDSTANVYPFTDVQVVTGASGFNFTFGGVATPSGHATSGAQQQPLITVVANTLQNGTNITNINIVNTTQGNPAQGIGSFTCTQTGPNFVAAGALNTIGTSITGWASVVNQLDCLTGTNVESDTAALQRRTASLQAQANGPLEAIVEKVGALTNVVTAIGFENLNEAALQVITYGIQPASGSFQLVLEGTPTSTIPYNANAAAIQAAINAVSGYSEALVTGTMLAGFTVDFNGSFGGEPVSIIQVLNNTTGVVIEVAFGRPGKSFEIVVEGGDDTLIAQTIIASKPAGIQTYGSTQVEVFDNYGNPYQIQFSRPIQVPIYVAIVLETDYTHTTPKFNPQSVQTIQEDIVSLGNQVGIGGLIIGFGTNGLVGAFNSVPGILSYTLFFGTSPNPTTNSNIQMASESVPIFETFNCSVSYT